MTNKEITRYSAPVIQAYRDMEDELLMLIGRQLGKYGRLTDTARWRVRQLAKAGEINRKAIEIIDSYADGITAEVYEAVIAAAESEVGKLDGAMLNLLSEKGELTDEAAQVLGSFERQSRQEMNVANARIANDYAQALAEQCNLVNTVMGYSVRSMYVSAVDTISRAAVHEELNAGGAAVVSGNESLNEAVRRTIHRMAEKGIPGFVDKAGREWTPEAYVRMDLRSTMGNTARAAQDERCDAYGISLIEVSSHMGARPKCAPYQGRIFSRDGSRGTTKDINGNPVPYSPLSETSYGEPDGLFGINCGHQQYPFIPGLSLQRYYPYDEERNAERYREFQMQRAMERKIRADKRDCMMQQAAGNEEGLKEAAKRLKLDKDKYRDYSKAHGLGVHNENTQVYGYDRSKSMKTVWAQKKGLTGGSNGGIINEKEIEYGIPYGKHSVNADLDYIHSDEYKQIFSSITDNPKVNESLYNCSVLAIEHRSGTLYEDIYFIHGETGDVLAKQLDSVVEKGVTYNDEIKELLKKAKEENIPIISLHNHPEGYPPSVDDFNKSYENNTLFGVAAGHNGQIYKYENPQKKVNNANDIHDIIALRCQGGTDPDRAFAEELSQVDLKYTIVK